jgi:CubicO group peptidase (beta-lactamase class C family)
MRNRSARAVIFLACIFGVAAPSRAQSATQWSSLDNFITSAMHQAKVPGMAVGIVQDGKAVYVKGFGVRNIQTGRPVTPETLFDIGSCTKAFTAAAVAMLVDRGKMQWDGRVNQYIPFFHLYDPLADENVTMRDLLTHRTGLQGTDLLWYGTSYSLPEIIHRVGLIKPDAGFRTVFQYQNVMYATAGYAVGEVSGGTWQDFVRQNIFTPLDMSGADFSATDAQQAPDYATPHRELPDGSVTVIPWRNIDSVAPAGSINSGVDDMTKWIAMQLNDGAAGGKQLISKKSMEEMHTPQIVVPGGGEFNMFFPAAGQMSYGMGWFIQDYHGHRLLLHPGDIDGFASLVVLIPDVNTGFVILSNLDHNPVRAGLGYHLIDLFLNLPQQDWVAHFAKIGEEMAAADKKEEAETLANAYPNTHPSRDLAAYAGTYRNSAYGDAVVSLDGDRLKMQFHSFSGMLSEFHFDTFLMNLGALDGNARVTFTLDEDGNVATLSTLGIQFTRVQERKGDE